MVSPVLIVIQQGSSYDIINLLIYVRNTVFTKYKYSLSTNLGLAIPCHGVCVCVCVCVCVLHRGSYWGHTCMCVCVCTDIYVHSCMHEVHVYTCVYATLSLR